MEAKKLKVLYFVGSLGAGGIERYISRISLMAIEKEDFEPIVCCLSEKKGLFLELLLKNHIAVFEAPQGWQRNPIRFFKMIRLIRKISPDIVHSQVNFSLLQQYLAVKAAGRANFCITERSCYQLKGFARLRRFLQFHTIRIFGAHFSANCLAVSLHLSKLVNFPIEKIFIIPNGIEEIPTDINSRAKVRLKLGWTDEEIGIGYIARMHDDKGHKLFLQAIREIIAKGYKVKACFLGDGPQFKSLEDLVCQLELQKYMTFKGIVSNIEEYLHAFDIVALFSYREGMPNAILEAMASGKTIVATNVGAIPELLDEGRAGVVVNEFTIGNLAASLESVLQDQKQRLFLSEKAKMRAKNIFSIENAYKQLLQYYYKVP
jgi:glycosyltransferase involved in cell wall biosynthesis